jgi:beta-phosphoglucomutase-like phosphatase (HAD superfamily)
MYPELSRIQALCFDVDGTLSDTDDLFVRRLARWLRPLSFLLPDRDPLRYARWLVMATETPGTYLFGLPDRLGFDDEIAALGDWIYRLGLGKNPRPFLLVPGVCEMLSQLQGRFPMSIVSARGERSTRAFLEQFELSRFFHTVVTAQTCAHTKPYPDPILFAARQMGVPPETCLMIGDTTVDMRAGKAAGAQTVGVLCGFGQEAELLRAGADLILPTTPLLASILNV